MAKLETDFSEYTGAHVFYAHVPYRSATDASGRKSIIDGSKSNLKMSLLHAMFTYVIKSTDRVIGYIDDDNMCYILSNSSTDIGYNGYTDYKILTSNYNNTDFEYKAQTSVEQNIASGMIEYVSGKKSRGENIISTTACVNLPTISYDEPTYSSYSWNTTLIGYSAKYPNGKLGWGTSQILYDTKDTTQLVIHVDDAGMYGTAPVQGTGLEGYITNVPTFIGSNFATWVEQTALANNDILDKDAQSIDISSGSNIIELLTNTMPDSNAIIYNLITTHDYNAALKFLSDGTIPADAKVNVKKDESEEDADNESGEDGSKESKFDENEPSAPAVNSVKLSNLHNYWITQNQMQSFYSSVWETDLTDFVKGAFTGIYSNLISNVVSLKFMPTTAENLGGTGDTSPVILGFKTYDDLTVQTIGNTTAPIVNIGSYKFSKEYNSFADYAPYTDVKLYLPFVGVVPIDTNLFMGSGGGETATLNVKAQYDLQSGLITYFLMRNKTMISSVSGHMAVEVPISLQSGLDTFSTISRNFSGKVWDFAMEGAKGNPIGMISEIAQGSATAPPQTIFASTGGDGAFYAHPKCMIMIKHPQYNRPKNYSHVVGFPAYVTKKVSDLQGFNIVQNPVIPLADGMTGAEHDMIITAMQSGLYY